ncbi:hypothetical protein [Paenimyroides baculatum]|uniref:Uncharacterized protein n=1 Tax=Paenimyroides baculatum TaxID=2608000 RepID=A0A5M6CE79_9FLAO|nr:hypothetical protein [Paenimyroides baculatum]KAA5531755.1 hypothetical protein F0460_15300 [Paenimyroides baculatum]
MKILKYSLIMLLFTIFGCNSDQSNLDVVTEEEHVTTYQTNSVSVYNLEEILNGIRKWDSLRNSPDVLVPFFENYNALNIDMTQFPQGNALHAYACVLNGKLKFAIISEVYDHESYQANIGNYIKVVDLHNVDIANVTNQTYESYTFPLPTQYIQAADAINRIQDWNANYNTWLNSGLPVYQSFRIPTYSLQAQNYTVYFGLKDNTGNASVKLADLVFYDNVDLFYDNVRRRPPYPSDEKYYILDLI